MAPHLPIAEAGAVERERATAAMIIGPAQSAANRRNAEQDHAFDTRTRTIRDADGGMENARLPAVRPCRRRLRHVTAENSRPFSPMMASDWPSCAAAKTGDA